MLGCHKAELLGQDRVDVQLDIPVSLFSCSENQWMESRAERMVANTAYNSHFYG